MQQSKLINFFKQLSANEFLSLKGFIKANCKNKKCIQLFDIIAKQYPIKLDSSTLTKQKVFAKLLPNEHYNDNKLLKLMSELYRNIEQFIITETVSKDVAYQKMALIQYYFNHSLDSPITQEIKEINAYFQTQKLATKQFADKIKLEEILLNINEKENNRYVSYQALFDSLTHYYQTSNIKIKNLSLINLKNDVVENETKNPIYIIHAKLNFLLTTDDEINYLSYFNLLKSYQTEIAPIELKTGIIILADYCIKKINAKQQPFVLHLFNLYNLLIQHQIILEDNHTIIPAIYKNIVTISLRLNKLSFTEKFIEEYKEFLPIEIKEDVYLYNKANLLFYQKEYDKVLQSLRTSKFKDVFYKLSSRRLQIKVFYTLLKKDETYFEILQNTLNAFKKYIYTNDEVTENYKEGNKNFLRFIYKLIELDVRQQNHIIDFFYELDTVSQIAEYDWLKENASAFLKKIK